MIGKPVVTTDRAVSYIGEEDILLPIQAIRSNDTNNYVFLLRSEQGYSRTIYIVYCMDVEIIEFDDEYVVAIYNPGGITTGDLLIIDSTDELNDKDRVILTENRTKRGLNHP